MSHLARDPGLFKSGWTPNLHIRTTVDHGAMKVRTGALITQGGIPKPLQSTEGIPPVYHGQGLTLLPGLEYSALIAACCNLKFPRSSNLPASTSQVAETTGMLHDTQLLNSSDPPASAFQSAGITGLSH
ncbi:putative uncharacterized protein encoded by LINC00269 [Macaca nemestrina]|uniref:putative uncharacterized protein encoded by LINC00269 n=1 Tax=Macaca nemestrina TaxID=9545 RepID=UPI0005F41586|nr:putative uncharacterized protein encoded by LINC00269 [Macaca nemestrina]